MSLLATEAAAEGWFIATYILSIALHEAGHAVAAWWLQLDLRSVTLGRGPALVRLRRGGVLFTVRIMPISGFVGIAVRPGMSNRRYAAMVAAGPAVNALLLGLVAAFHRMHPDWELALLPAAVSQCLLLALALVPMRSRSTGRASDGMQLWLHLVRTPPPDLFGRQYAGLAATLFPQGTPLPAPSHDAPDLFYSMLRLDRLYDAWAARDAAAAVRRVVDRGALTPLEQALAFDFLAGNGPVFGVMATPAEMEHWSAEAGRLAPGVDTTITRAGVLANTGRGAEAEAMLRPLLTGETAPLRLFLCRLHLAQAAAAQGHAGAARDWLAMARAGLPAGALRRFAARLLDRAEARPPLANRA